MSSRSRTASTRLRACRIRAVRPMVSMKVTWVLMVAETMGTKVSYLTFLSNVSGLSQERSGHDLT